MMDAVPKGTASFDSAIHNHRDYESNRGAWGAAVVN
jgi:hypothetical protein